LKGADWKNNFLAAAPASPPVSAPAYSERGGLGDIKTM